MTQLNLGCGFDYREGWVNVDGDVNIKADMYLDLSTQDLAKCFPAASVDTILMKDIIEHFTHRRAKKLLSDCYVILKPGGKLRLSLPDIRYVIASYRCDEALIMALFGGQDLLEDRDLARASHMEFFCHRFWYTESSLAKVLKKIGFKEVVSLGDPKRIVVEATK